MAKLNVYLNFKNNSKDVLEFYQTALGGKIEISLFKDMPGSENMKPEDLEKVLHGALVSGDIVIMASDTVEGFGPPIVVGNNLSLCIQSADVSEAKVLFNALSKDGQIIMPLEKTFWGAIYGSFVDKFGINWMINCETE